jgi:hypothetical protein
MEEYAVSSMKTRAYDSIQDFLLALGFSVDQEQGQFSKWNTAWQFIVIPFSELAGHTAATFIEKARSRGWLPTEPPLPTSEPETSLYI